MPAIAVDRVSKQYATRNGSVLALSDISFEIRDNEFVAILGSSGCGKSTLLKIIAGLIPATGGEVRAKDKRVTAPLEDIGMVFQSALLLKWRSAWTTSTYRAGCSRSRGNPSASANSLPCF